MVNDNSNQLLNNYLNHLSSKGKTRSIYERTVREYLEYAGDNHDRKTVDAFLEHTKRKHSYGNSSLNFVFRVIRTFYNRNKLDWPYNRGEAPIIREKDVQAPALHPNIIKKMISFARNTPDKPELAGYLALSTTYGLRRQEMLNLAPEPGETPAVNLKDRTIYIGTLKHGRERTHIIPEPIIPYLEKMDLTIKRSESYIFMLWYQLENMIGMTDHIEHVGWHSVRRTLDTLLLRTFPKTTVEVFLRWNKGASQDMAFRYSAVKFVGEEASTELQGEDLSVDSEIFSKDGTGQYRHPFLSEWI